MTTDGADAEFDPLAIVQYFDNIKFQIVATAGTPRHRPPGPGLGGTPGFTTTVYTLSLRLLPFHDPDTPVDERPNYVLVGHYLPTPAGTPRVGLGMFADHSEIGYQASTRPFATFTGYYFARLRDFAVANPELVPDFPTEHPGNALVLTGYDYDDPDERPESPGTVNTPEILDLFQTLANKLQEAYIALNLARAEAIELDPNHSRSLVISHTQAFRTYLPNLDAAGYFRNFATSYWFAPYCDIDLSVFPNWVRPVPTPPPAGPDEEPRPGPDSG